MPEIDENQKEKPPKSPIPLRRPRKLDIDKDKIVQRIITDYTAAKTDRKAWETAQTKWIEMYEGILGERIFPYGPDASSNYHVPLCTYNILRLHAVLMNVFESADRIVYVEGESSEDERRAQEKIQPYMNWEVRTHMEALPIIDKEILYYLIRGTWIGFVPWVVEYHGGVDIHSFPLPSPLPTTEEEWASYFIGIFEKIQADAAVKVHRLRPKNDNPFSLTVDYTEQVNGFDVKRKAEVEIYIDDDKVEMDIEKQIKDYEGPRLFSTPLEDIYLSKDCARLGIQKCSFVMRKLRLNLEDVRQNKELGRWEFDDNDWNDILAHVDKLIQDAGNDIKKLKEEIEGVNKLASLQETQELEALECYYLYDINGDGLKEQVIFTIILGADVLVRAVRLEENYRSGYRPFFKTVFIPREDSPYGKSLPELLEDTQDLYNELFDLLVDFTKITTAPFGVYRTTSSFKPEKIYYEPGALLGVDDVSRDVAFPSWPQQNHTGLLNIIGMLNQFAERLTSQGAIQFGQVPTGKSSALRTFGTFMGLMQQGDILANRILGRLYYGLSEFFKIVFRHNQEYMPDTNFRIMGNDGRPQFLSITREDLRGNFNFRFSATTESENKSVQREVALALAANLLTPLAIQSGIVKEDNIYNILKELVLALEKIDVSAFLTKPLMLEAGPILDADQVIALLSQGEKPKVNPAANLREHIERISDILRLEEAVPGSTGIQVDYLPLFEEYLAEAIQVANALVQRQELVEAARQSQNIFGQIIGGDGGGVPTTAQPLGENIGFAEGLQAEQEFI